MKKTTKKLSLKKISIAKIENSNNVKGGTITTNTIFGCDYFSRYGVCSFEPDTNVSLGCPPQSINCSPETLECLPTDNQEI